MEVSAVLQETWPLRNLRAALLPKAPILKFRRGRLQMKVKRRIEIITVREQTYQNLHREKFTPPLRTAWCDGCQTHTQMLTPDLAAHISGITLRTLFQWIESGHIHFVETPEGSIFVCLESVTAHAIQS